MGISVETENRRQIAADGTIFEVLEDGTIKRIGKLSEEGKFEPFRTPKNWTCPQCGTENESGDNFCGKCGKPADVKESNEDKGAKPVKQQKTEEQIMMDPDNYVDKGDYIELVHPVGNIKMIQKYNVISGMFSKVLFSWNEAIKFAKELRIGGFSDWRIPTKEELKMIYKIKDICGINVQRSFWFSPISYANFFWSSSHTDDNSIYVAGFDNGVVCSGDKMKGRFLVRCVR